MISVRINGEDSSIKGDGLPRLADVIELIKSAIDPEHMITSILINGRDLEEAEWRANTTQLGTAILEIETGTPQDFVTDRMARSPMVIGSCFFQFRDARKSFQTGDMVEGNQKLGSAVNTLQAFFQWYGSMMELLPLDEQRGYDISTQIREVSKVCERICQQQLYQSWWALGETIEKDLEPVLDRLEDTCRKFRTSV